LIQVACDGLLVIICGLLLVACSVPGSVKPTVKIGLSAPFEGRYRDLGYEVLHAVRLAVRQRNGIGGVGDRYLIELVALNDFDDADEAVVQARKMSVDRDVLGVLGAWSAQTGGPAAAEYERLDLALLAPDVDFTEEQPAQAAEPAFSAEYEVLSGGTPPGPAAIWAYREANRLLDAIDTASHAGGLPTRKDVSQALVTDPSSSINVLQWGEPCAF
jgi:hypothetical protein